MFGFLKKAAGVVITVSAIALLAWNESHSFHAHNLFAEAASKLIIVDDTTTVDPTNEGRLLFMNVWAHIGDDAVDPLYGIGGQYLSVERQVQYYQWHEKAVVTRARTSHGTRTSSTTYEYHRAWSDKVIDPAKFSGSRARDYDNTPVVQIEPLKTYSHGAKLGPYLMAVELIDSMPSLNSDVTGNGGLRNLRLAVALDSTSQGGSIPTHQEGDIIYYGNDPAKPTVGDVRVKFVYRVPSKVWVLAQAHSDSIRPFVGSENYWLTYSRVNTQQFDPREEIEDETWGFDVLVWVLRVIGWLLMVWGIRWSLGIITSLLAGVPVVGMVATAAASLVSWVLGTVMSVLVIALSFLVIRPVVSLCLLGVLAIVALACWHVHRSHKARSNRPLPPPLPPQ
ncbi:MAG: TMEM43 family protein [Muribaculaceae bacterium]|nr:TMEM43 family protein [Muribaculaceae bacterium]